jgi:ribose transport system permease protein
MTDDSAHVPQELYEGEPRRRRVRSLPKTKLDLPDLAQRLGLILAWAIVVLVFGILRPSTFLTQANFATIFGSQGVLVILTLALLITLTAGDFDITVAYVAGLSAMIVAILNVNYGLPIVVSILVALGTGVLTGIVNGILVVFFRVDSLIATLGMGTVISGVILWISASNTISGVSNELVDWVIVKRVFGIPIEFYYGLVLAALMWYVFEFTPLGRRLLFVGRGRNVARLSGIRVDRLRVGAYIVSGFISAVAGVMYAGTTGAADPTSASSFLLPSFAAAFLGATSIVPGRFNPWGSIIAVYFLVTGITGLQLLGVQSFIQQLFYGGALVFAVVLSQIARRGEVQEPSSAGGP